MYTILWNIAMDSMNRVHLPAADAIIFPFIIWVMDPLRDERDGRQKE